MVSFDLTQARFYSTGVRLNLTAERVSLTVVSLDLTRVRLHLTGARLSLTAERFNPTAVNLDLPGVRLRSAGVSLILTGGPGPLKELRAPRTAVLLTGSDLPASELLQKAVRAALLTFPPSRRIQDQMPTRVPPSAHHPDARPEGSRHDRPYG